MISLFCFVMWVTCIPFVVIAMNTRWGNCGWTGIAQAAFWPIWVVPMLVYWIIVSTPELRISQTKTDGTRHSR